MVQKNEYKEASAHLEWFQWCKSLLELYTTEKQFVIDNDVYKLSHLGMRRWILGHNFEGVDFLLRNLLLDAMLSSSIPGSEIYVPWFLYNQLEVQPVKRLESQKYLDYTLSLSKHKFTKDVFNAVYHVAGPLTKIIVKPSLEPDVVIKSRNSFCFPLKLDSQFHRMLGYVEFIEQTNPIIVMIEGAPETVGEINSLLERNHESKRPVILVARSFPEEISATLATNWLKGSLSILPLVYGDALDTINLAADLCAVSQGELISAHFGDIIPAVICHPDKWGSVDKVEWNSKGLSIYKDINVSSHVNRLINKLKTIENEELEDLIRERILSLSNDAIEVWVPKEKIQLIEELDSLIKHYNAFVTSGAVDTPLGMLPKSFIDAAQATAQSLQKEILNIGGFLVRAKDEVVA